MSMTVQIRNKRIYSVQLLMYAFVRVDIIFSLFLMSVFALFLCVRKADMIRRTKRAEKKIEYIKTQQNRLSLELTTI